VAKNSKLKSDPISTPERSPPNGQAMARKRAKETRKTATDT
jgi:hypothetical protein